MTWRWFVDQVWPNLFASLLWVVPGYGFHSWHVRHEHARRLADALDAAHRRLEEYAAAVDRERTAPAPHPPSDIFLQASSTETGSEPHRRPGGVRERTLRSQRDHPPGDPRPDD